MLSNTKDLYTRSTLIWTWVPRLIICVILFALGVKDYVVLNNWIYSDSDYDDVRGALGRSFALIAGFTLGTLLLDGVEALLYAKGKLNPVFYLVSNIAKLIVWAFYFVLAVIVMVWAGGFALAAIPAVLLV
ncbi:hypothetical protein BDZ85DRAFT_283568 [Elsinoe ampelina]|uniref:Uncharacterized protein n=1 Tax=Elsinoe ampelina TaxID=302913 RepID=A0A6A6G732_9PEZI|nr:hypothetical protein BDZ85DRAFT_283568 [Elsinoe ampelina]